MRHIMITIETINESFQPDCYEEVVRILRDTANNIDSQGFVGDCVMRDTNGAPVGRLVTT